MLADWLSHSEVYSELAGVTFSSQPWQYTLVAFACVRIKHATVLAVLRALLLAVITIVRGNALLADTFVRIQQTPTRAVVFTAVTLRPREVTFTLASAVAFVECAVAAGQLTLVTCFPTPEAITRARTVILQLAMLATSLVTRALASLLAEFSLIHTFQRTVVAGFTSPISIAFNTMTSNRAPSLVAGVTADLTFFARCERVVALAPALIRHESGVVLALNIACLTLMSSESTDTLACACLLVQHTTIEAAGRALLALRSGGQWRAVALALVIPCHQVSRMLTLKTAGFTLSAGPWE